MTISTAPDPTRETVRRHLESALAESDDSEVRFHLRQALQMIH